MRTTQLYVSFSPMPNDASGQTEAVAAIERCIKDIRKQMLKNKLMMNDNQAQFIIIGTRQQLMKINISHITTGDSEIVPLSPVKNLGAWFDETLSMNSHITKATSAAHKEIPYQENY